MFGKIFKIILNTVLGILIAIGILAVSSFLPIPGNIKLLIVQSGSMEPAIHKGSLIFVKTMGEYSVGDVITRKTDDPKVTITHRILKKEEVSGKTVFETKGDANNVSDGEKISEEMIIGKELWSLPYLGYLVGFAKTMPGLILFIIIPAVIIIYDEMNKIKKEIGKMRAKKKAEKETRQNKIVENKLVYPEPQFARRVELQEVKKRKIV
jgi:signal peptidase I